MVQNLILKPCQKNHTTVKLQSFESIGTGFHSETEISENWNRATANNGTEFDQIRTNTYHQKHMVLCPATLVCLGIY